MTKQEAITIIRRLKSPAHLSDPAREALEMAIKALSNDPAIAVVNELIMLNNNMIIKASKDQLATTPRDRWYEGLSTAYHGRNLTYEALLKRLKAEQSLAFVMEFAACYAKSPITHVMVEYEEIGDSCDTVSCKRCNCKEIDNVLKVNPKDNTITIRKVKDNWNREEVIALCKSARDSVGVIEFEKWVNQNL